MHGLGGTTIALGIYTVYDLRVRLPRRWLNLIPVLAGVLIIALAWEIFEIYAGIPVEPVDTAIDIIMALIGGVIGFFVGSAINKL